MLVKGMIRAELREIAEGRRADPHTGAAELGWIHNRCARQNLRVVLTLKQLDRLSIPAVEAFAYHITQQIELLPTRQRNVQRQHNRKLDEIVARFADGEEHFAAATLWDIAHQVVRKDFLEVGHSATRMYGQFEAKARILDLLVRSAEKNSLSDGQALAFLHKEISACWMNAGRLQSANVNISQCLASLQRSLTAGKRKRRHRGSDGRGIASYLHDRIAKPTDEEADQTAAQLWRLAAEATSFQATVTIRLGRTSYQAEEVLESFLPIAEKIADWQPPSELDRHRKSRRAFDAGAIKLLSRSAEIQMLQGREDIALASFRKADRMQVMSKRRRLDGEAARKLSVLLVRRSSVESDTLPEALSLIEANIRTLQDVDPEQYGRISNDIIPFLIMRAGILRVGGHHREAARQLKEVLDHEYFRSGECTYIARQEALIEGQRQKMVTLGSRTRSTLASELTKMAQSLDNSHHYLLGAELRLLGIEALPPGRRNDEIQRERRYWVSNGYAMRLDDLAELSEGRSAVERYGF